MAPTKVSVVIPCHNRHDLLNRALASVRAQRGQGTDFTLEVIIVDDASNPPLRPTLNAADRCIRLDANGGAAHARNVGCKAATGDVIAFLDSDDQWLETKIARQLEVLRQHRRRTDDVSPVVVCSGYRTRRRSGLAFQEVIPNSVDSLVGFVSGCRFCPGSTALLPRDVFEDIGPFDEKLLRLEDYDWYIRLALHGGRVLIAPEALANIEPNGFVDLVKVTSSACRLRQKYGTQLTDMHVNRPFLSYLDLVCAEAKLVNGQRLASAIDLSKSLLRYPRARLQLLADAPPVASRASDEGAA